MNILYLPLDERPCNYRYPNDIASTNSNVQLIRPELDKLGLKKQEANFTNIKAFLEEHCDNHTTIICSIDMVVYGGLIPSRIHHYQFLELEARLMYLQQLKEQYPKLKIYGFSSIMRTPSYSSSDEEPDYYEQYGEQIYKRKAILDKIARLGDCEQLNSELNAIDVPDEIIKDYEQRRATNLQINRKVLELVKSTVIDHLVIFQDDSAPYGYTAIDQKNIKDYIHQLNLDFKVDIYPGADEVGCSLLSRAYNEANAIQNKIYVEYSSINGPQLTPLYEDRPMYETLKSHIDVTNSIIVESPAEADYLLMINAPGEKMQESWDQFEQRDRTYDSHRNLKYFVAKIKYYIDLGKKVAIADCAYANGCDIELIRLLDELNLLDKIYGYTGWNTHANTLGTVISTMQITEGINHELITNNINHIIEAGFYQAIVRMDITKNTLSKYDLNYFDLKQHQATIVNLEIEQLSKLYKQLNISEKYPLQLLEVLHPWNRMFEIDVNIKI
ncbi:DUF4127 family protein [Mollicutes bacterium LVI A0039]|nr:DUF4127 family protein [Mollicutes bacterium LVI A0039]